MRCVVPAGAAMGSDAGGIREVLKGRLKEAAAHVLHDVTSGKDAVPAELSVEPVFTSDKPWDSPQWADCLVIACGDSRFLPYYHQFLAESLKIPDYHMLMVPGGVQWLSLPDVLPKHSKVLRGAVEFFQRRKNVKRVVCIAHQACGVYNDNQVLGTLAHLATGKSVADHQIDQLKTAAQTLNNSYGLLVELYYASISGKEIVFHRIE